MYKRQGNIPLTASYMLFGAVPVLENDGLSTAEKALGIRMIKMCIRDSSNAGGSAGCGSYIQEPVFQKLYSYSCLLYTSKVNDRPVDEFGRDYRQVTPKGMRKLSGKRIEFGRDSGEGH